MAHGVLLALALTVPPVPSVAQVLQGVVVDAESRSPLPAVLVILVDSAGRDLQRFLVDQKGAFRFLLPGGGSYSVRAERIGTDTGFMEEIGVSDGETVSVRIPMTVRPVALEGIEVLGESRCELADDATGQVQRVWAEARKVLTAQSFTDEQGWYRYDLAKYTRNLDPASLGIQSETVSARRATSQRPIRSVPADELLEHGFVLQDEQGIRYLAPDAEVLLSNDFLGTHCFTLGAGFGDTEGLLSLGFRPQSRPSQITDIEGTLWIEAATGHLKWLEYRYLNLPAAAGALDSEHVGGRVEFLGFSDGTWIVSKWWIRMPVIVEERLALIGDIRFRLSQIVEEGGRVTKARRYDSETVAFSEKTGTIAGHLSQPTAGATVLVMGVGVTVDVDDRGRFQIDGLAEGRYRLALVRPRMMGLDRTYSVAEASVSEGETSQVDLTVPLVGTLLAAACGLDEWVPGEAVLVGEVIDPETGIARRNVPVQAEWQVFQDLDLETGSIQATDAWNATMTDESGAFRLCGVPDNTTARVTARLEEDRFAGDFVRIASGRPVMSIVLDSEFEASALEQVTIARSTFRTRVITDSQEAEARGDRESELRNLPAISIRVVGTVEASESGHRLEGATVRIGGLTPVLTDGRGLFSIMNVPLGRNVIEVEYMGRQSSLDTLVLEGLELAGLTIRLDERPIPVEGLDVVVEQRSLRLDAAGFYDRRDLSGISGTHISRDYIEERPTARVSDLLSTVRGARIMPGRAPGSAVMVVNRPDPRKLALLEGGARVGCEPAVYLDGLVYQDMLGGSYDVSDLNFLSTEVIDGIEVYVGLNAPARFDSRGCGVIVIWTRGNR